MHREDSELQAKKAELAIVMARGQSVIGWARKNEVPERTVYRWASEPEVRKASDMWRRTILDQAIGRMVRRARAAVDGIERLAKDADSESVRLSAWRALLADQIAVAKFSALEGRMLEVEQMLEAPVAQQPSALG
jgi:hypothetical protein